MIRARIWGVVVTVVSFAIALSSGAALGGAAVIAVSVLGALISTAMIVSVTRSAAFRSPIGDEISERVAPSDRRPPSFVTLARSVSVVRASADAGPSGVAVRRAIRFVVSEAVRARGLDRDATIASRSVPAVLLPFLVATPERDAFEGPSLECVIDALCELVP